MVIPFVIGTWFWFQATKQRYMWNHTTFGPARFHATMTGKGLFELKLTNLFLLICTLGLAWPWVQTRNLQFLYYHVGLQGPLNLKQVVQEAGHPGLKASFDNGHALMFSDAPAREWVDVLGDYLAHCHLHDNDGQYDQHLPIGQGIEDWPILLDALHAIESDPLIVLESDQFDQNVTSLESIRLLLIGGAA